VPILAAAALLLGWGAAHEWVADFAPVYPAVFVIGALQCWKFRRTRLLFAVVLVAMADRILLHFAGPDAMAEPMARAVYNAVAVLFPLNFLLVSAVPERGPTTLRSLLLWVAVIAQPGIVGRLLAADDGTLAGILESKFLGEYTFEFTSIPHLGILAFTVALVALVARLFWEPSEEKSAQFWALLAGLLAIGAGEGALASTTYYAAAGLMIVQAVIDTSYRLAYQDALTHLPTRRGFNEALEQVVGHWTVAMVDVDHFKAFNDKHGHEVGDQVLRMVAAEMGKVTGGGKSFRYGGEEFAILFANKRVEQVQPHIEKLRGTIAGRVFTIRGAFRPRKRPDAPKAGKKPRRTLKITVSIGAADSTDPKESVDDVVKAADVALYQAKQAGRNRVWIRAKPKI
jgi:diguanylate cyclase (GGDEF)-like protein